MASELLLNNMFGVRFTLRVRVVIRVSSFRDFFSVLLRAQHYSILTVTTAFIRLIKGISLIKTTKASEFDVCRYWLALLSFVGGICVGN